MGRFSATLLLLLGACGDNVDVDGLGAGPADDIQPGGTGDVVPRYVPQVCGVNSWTPSFAGDPAMNVSVVARPGGGATLLAVPTAGGDPLGFNLDPRMNMVGEGTKLDLGQTFDQITVSYIQDRPVATGIHDGAVYVNMLDVDLTSPQYIAKIPGNFIGEPTFLHAQGNLVMPVVNETGLWMHRFQDSLEPIDVKHFKATGPATSMTASQLGTAMVTAWSTDTSCHMMVNSTYEPGVSASVSQPCSSPRLAINQKDGEGVMLFESAEGIRLMTIHTTMIGGDARVIRADASSPRTLFDGTNFWISYIDTRGDVVVGFLDAQYRPVTMSLGAPQPERQGYELAWVDGSPWIFSVDAGGYTAYRMCVDTQW